MFNFQFVNFNYFSICCLLCIPCSYAKEEMNEKHDLFNLSIEQLLQLEVITASKLPEPFQLAPATIMVVTSQDILLRGYTSIEDALRDLPGIDFVDVQGTFPLIWSPRGAYGDENKRTLMMIDGIVENNILEGNVLGGPQYSLHNVERIEVIWGPASALYGANAFSGIINIITRKGKDIRGAEFQIGGGSFGTRLMNFSFGDVVDNIDYVFSGSIYNSDGPVFKERHPNYSLSYIDDAYSLNVKLNTAYFGINASRYDRPMGHGQFSNSSAEFFGLPLYGYNNTEGKDIYGTIAPISIDGQKGSLWHSITNTLAITAQQNINENLIIDERIYYRKTEIADDSYVYGKLSDNAFNFLPFTHSSNLTGIEIQTSYFINDQQALILGVNFENSNIERGYRGVSINSEKPLSWEFVDERISDDYQNRAFYGQYQFETNILNSTIFTLGIRRDQNNIYGDTTNPRVGIVNQVTEKLTLKALYGSAFRAPNSFDTFSKTTTRIPNPNLEPELMHNLEFSAGYQFNDDFYLETNFFSNKLTDTIISNVDIGDIDGNGANNTQNQNLGDAKIKGIEFKTLFTLSNDLSGFSAISYQSPKQEFEGMSDDIPNVTDIKVNFGLVWQYDDKSSIYMITRYVGERTTAKTNPRNEVDSYLVMDLHLLKQNIFESNITMSLKINNLFNSSIADPGVRSADGLSFSTQHTYPGQNVILKISYHY